MGQRNARGRSSGNARMTGADGVSVLPAAMVAALVAAGVAITRSVRRSRAAVRQLKAKAGPGERITAAGSAPSGQTAVRATVDDDGR